MFILSPKIEAILLDIEGTLCSISFVKDILFPYAITSLSENLETLWITPNFQPYLNAFHPSSRTDPNTFLNHIKDLMAADNKMPALKNLQGFLWRSGYESGALRCTLFSDVAPVLQKWNSSGLKIFIYSSGSVAAQKLLFQYTDSGDLRLYINDYYDTVNAGAKNDSQSYASIIAGGPDHLRRAEKWLFCSDRTCEVEAALTVGLEALVVVRPGNIPLDAEESSRFHLVQSLADISLDGRANGDSLS